MASKGRKPRGTIKGRYKGGAPCKLTRELLVGIIELLAAGNYLSTVATAASVSTSSLKDWAIKGQALARAGRQDPANRPPYREFYEGVMRAQRDAEVNVLATIRQAANGHEPVFDVVDKVVAGKVVKIRVCVKKGTPPDWKAAAWIAERRWPEHWGRLEPSQVAKDRATARAMDALADKLGDGEQPAETTIDVEAEPVKALGLRDEDDLHALAIGLAKHMTNVERAKMS